MLLLDESDVESCYLWSEQHRQPLPALQYKEKRFLEVPCSQALDLARAIALARSLDDKTEGKLRILVVKYAQHCNVWREAPQLLRSNPVEAQELIQQFQLEDVVVLMRHAVQLEKIKHRQGLRHYSGCFTGQTAIRFLMQQYQLSEANAIRLGQRLLTDHLISAIGRQSLFTNSTLLYRFR